MTAMTTSQTLSILIKGVYADVTDYREMKGLLEDQFNAALHHRVHDMKGAAERITAMVEVLDARRREREELARRMLGERQPATMAAVFRLLPAAPRQAMQSWWQLLETLVNECKALNMRNCRLIMDQHEIMQRVLGSEENVYAPA